MNWISRAVRKTTEPCMRGVSEFAPLPRSGATWFWFKSPGISPFSVISVKNSPIISVIKERHPLTHHKWLPTEPEKFRDDDLLIHHSGNCSSCHRGDSVSTQKTTLVHQSIYAVFLPFCFLIDGEEPNTEPLCNRVILSSALWDQISLAYFTCRGLYSTVALLWRDALLVVFLHCDGKDTADWW